MKNKKWLIVLIVIFPSFFWLILELSTINSKKLPFYGPKKLMNSTDTIYYKVSSKFNSHNKTLNENNLSKLDSIETPLFVLIFLNEKYRLDSYRVAGLWEYLNYKKSKIENIPFILITAEENGENRVAKELEKLSIHNNVQFYSWKKNSFDSITKVYFDSKPIYIDYSFFMMIDGNRNIRGYYDGRYVSEFKRLIEEYQHLRLKEEKRLIINSNEIKQNKN